jgi:hypothetical protein
LPLKISQIEVISGTYMTPITLESTHATPSILPARAWLVVALLCVVGCLNYLDRIMITTMRTSILADMPKWGFAYLSLPLRISVNPI